MRKNGIVLALLVVGILALPIIEALGIDLSFGSKPHDDSDNSDLQAADGEFLWKVALSAGILRSHFCAGSIVTQKKVLTACHCVSAVVTGGQLSKSLVIRAGSNRWASGGQSYKAKGYVMHPEYDFYSPKNDIGFLSLATSITINNIVKAIPLAWDYVGSNVNCRTSGWGLTPNLGPLSDTLLQFKTSTIDNDLCVSEVARADKALRVRIPTIDTAFVLCTFFATNGNICNGDSGSALVRDSDNQQIGIVSWGLPCALAAPNIYVRLSAYKSWIESVYA